MLSPHSFLDRDNWTGGDYELAIRLGSRSDAGLVEIAQRVWSRLDLDGPYPTHDREPEDQDLDLIDLGTIGELAHHGGHVAHYGVARIRGWPAKTVVSTSVCRFGGDEDEFVLGIPMGSLAASNPQVGDYPFSYDPDTEPEWAGTLDDWLAEIAIAIRDVVPFRIAHIGWLIATVDSSRVYVDADGYHRPGIV